MKYVFNILIKYAYYVLFNICIFIHKIEVTLKKLKFLSNNIY